MIVNVDDVYADKPRFSSVLFVGFIVAWLLTLGYAYAPDVSSEVMVLANALLLLTVLYPVGVAVLFYRRRQVAQAHYEKHLQALTKPEFIDLMNHPRLSRFSHRIAARIGCQRFESNEQA